MLNQQKKLLDYENGQVTKLKRAQDNLEKTRPYAEKMMEIVSSLTKKKHQI